MAKRTPSGKARPGEQVGQSRVLSGLVTFTGSTVIDLKRGIKRKGGSVDEIPFDVLSVEFEDTGGAAQTHRLSTQENGDGTFTIRCSAIAIPAWQAGVAVTANAVTLPNAGHIIAVHATTATSTGPKSQVNAAPAAGQVQVAYNAAGIPTLTFNAGDAVTAISVTQIFWAASGIACTVRWKVMVGN